MQPVSSGDPAHARCSCPANLLAVNLHHSNYRPLPRTPLPANVTVEPLRGSNSIPLSLNISNSFELAHCSLQGLFITDFILLLLSPANVSMLTENILLTRMFEPRCVSPAKPVLSSDTLVTHINGNNSFVILCAAFIE